MDRLLVRKLAKTLLEYPLDKERTRIGRDPGNDIVLAGDLNISESHAEVRKRPTGEYIVDLGALNGTFLNGEIIIKEEKLLDGDKITIGQYTLVCRHGDEVNTAEDEASAVITPEVPPEAEEPAAEIIPAAEPAAVVNSPDIPPAEVPAPGIIPAAEPAPELPAEENEEPAAVVDFPDISPAEDPAPEIIPEAEPAPELPAAENEEPAAVVDSPAIPRAETPVPEIISAEPAAEPPADDTDDSFAATFLKVPKAETPAPGIMPAEPEQEPPPGGDDDSFESTSILKAPQAAAPAPEVIPAEPEPQAVETEDNSRAAPAAAPGPAPAGDRFAITSILKVPRKVKPAPGAAAESADLEEGVIEIEVQETPFWTKKRLKKAAVLTAAAGCAIFVLAVLRSAEFRGFLTPRSQISFNVVPDDAQVYVNGAEMPKPGSGVLRNLPAGRFSVKVSHSSYPAARTIDLETGLFKRRAAVESAPGGISTK